MNWFDWRKIFIFRHSRMQFSLSWWISCSIWACARFDLWLHKLGIDDTSTMGTWLCRLDLWEHVICRFLRIRRCSCRICISSSSLCCSCWRIDSNWPELSFSLTAILLCCFVHEHWACCSNRIVWMNPMTMLVMRKALNSPMLIVVRWLVDRMSWIQQRTSSYSHQIIDRFLLNEKNDH